MLHNAITDPNINYSFAIFVKSHLTVSNTIFGFDRERQLQLEELTKELKRVTEETDVLKLKLKSMKSANQVLIYKILFVLYIVQE